MYSLRSRHEDVKRYLDEPQALATEGGFSMLSQRNCLSSRTFAIFGLVMVGLIGIAQPAYCVTVSVSASLTADGLDLVATVTAGGSCGTINLYAAVDAPVDTKDFFQQ